MENCRLLLRTADTVGVTLEHLLHFCREIPYGERELPQERRKGHKRRRAGQKALGAPIATFGRKLERLGSALGVPVSLTAATDNRRAR